MVLPRFSPLVGKTGSLLAGSLLGLLVFSGSNCSKSDPGENKPSNTPAPDVSLDGVDTSSFTPRERREWASQVSELLAPCPEVPVSIATCVKERRPCKACMPAAQYLLKQVQAGKPKKDAEEAFHARFDQNKVKTLSLDNSPTLGPPDAVVTMVEWADFECPACRAMYPYLDELVHRFPGQVRLVYKFYPLSIHPHGEIAARAGYAAINQGKFWEMHHLLFENQERLEPPDLERYAKQLGLDVTKFKADVASKEATEKVDQDKKQAEGLGLSGTPFIFIDGREIDLKYFTSQDPYDDFVDWIKLDIELAGQVPKPAPTSGPGSHRPDAPPGSATAGPATSASAKAGPSASVATPPPSAKAPPKQ